MASIIGTNNADTLNGTAEDDTIDGLGGNDIINGGGGEDTITAGDGNDLVITGYSQYGTIDLGRGDDVLHVTGNGYNFTADGGEGVDLVELTNANASGANLTGFENLVVKGAGYLDGFSGYQSIRLIGASDALFGAYFQINSSNSPDADLSMSGQNVFLSNTALRSIIGSAADDGVNVYAGTVISGAVDLGAGNDQFAFLTQFDGDFTSAPAMIGSVTGGAGDDTIAVYSFGGGTVTQDLATVTGFETLLAGTSYTGGGAYQLSNVVDVSSIVVASNASLTLSQTSLAGAVIEGGDAITITLDTGTLVGSYHSQDFASGDQVVQFDRRDPTESVTFTNNGRVAGNIDFSVGDDRYDGRLGSVGGTVHGNGGNDTLLGGNGNDYFSGDAGDDTIDGGAGYDVAVFGGTLAQSSVTRGAGGELTITGPNGTDHLSNIEVIQFANGVLQLDSGVPLFDNLFYAQHNPDVFSSGADLLLHYRSHGAAEGRDPNAFFSTAGYLAANPDVAKAGIDPLAHYDQQGWREGRDPSAAFDTTLYLLHNPDVAQAGADPLAQYLTSGQFEGRQAYAAIGTHVMANGFDPDYYLLANPDVAAAGIDPYQHYLEFGAKEGRDPNSWFDDAGYLARYQDVADLGINPLQHYHDYGWKEGRDPSAAFDTKAYLAANPDVADLHIDPLVHYLQYGAYELRDPQSDGVLG